MLVSTSIQSLGPFCRNCTTHLIYVLYSRRTTYSLMDQPTANPKGETEWLTHTQQYNYGVCNVYLSAYRVVSWAARPHCSVHWSAYRVVHKLCKPHRVCRWVGLVLGPHSDWWYEQSFVGEVLDSLRSHQTPLQLSNHLVHVYTPGMDVSGQNITSAATLKGMWLFRRTKFGNCYLQRHSALLFG